MGVFRASANDRRLARGPRTASALLAAHEDVVLALQDGRSAPERLHTLLGVLCETLDFDLATVWRTAPDGRALHCAAAWHRDDPGVGAIATASLAQPFEPGRGLPGHVWETGTPTWTPRATWDPRLADEPRPALASAVAVPIGQGPGFEGVLELFAVERRERDDALLRFLGVVAAQLAQALAAWRSRDALARRDSALAADSAVAITDATDDAMPLVSVNPAFERLTGYRAAEVVGRASDLLLGADSDVDALERLHAAARAGREATEALLAYRKNGTPFWDEIAVSPVVDRDGRVVQVLLVHRDVTDRRIAEDDVEYRAGHDTVTGLPNRTLLHAALDRVVDRAGRYGLQVALVACEVAGADDDLLARAGERVQSIVRPGDLVARQGERDLAVVMADLEPEAAAQAAVGVAQRIHDALQDGVIPGCTIAVTLLGPGEATPVALLDRTRNALAAAGEAPSA